MSNQLFDNSYYQKFIFTTYQLLSFEFQPENKEKDLEKQFYNITLHYILIATNPTVQGGGSE